jgi:hypothetical protein
MARLASESNQMCHELRALVFLTSVPEAVDRGSWFWPMSQIGQWTKPLARYGAPVQC